MWNILNWGENIWKIIPSPHFCSQWIRQWHDSQPVEERNGSQCVVRRDYREETRRRSRKARGLKQFSDSVHSPVFAHAVQKLIFTPPSTAGKTPLKISLCNTPARNEWITSGNMQWKMGSSEVANGDWDSGHCEAIDGWANKWIPRKIVGNK